MLTPSSHLVCAPHSGRIDGAELTHAFEKTGFTCPAEVISAMLKYAGNGENIDLRGFVRLSGYLEFMRSSFDKADADKSGAVCIELGVYVYASACVAGAGVARMCVRM
jgi:Ca2+-binding EF-hand superfamily protein